MGYFTLSGGLILVTPLLSLLAMTVTGESCTGKPPVIDPPVLVVKYEGPAAASCSAQHTAELMGWEARMGAKTKENTQQLDWSVSSTGWSLSAGIQCFTTSAETGQCETHLPITIYKIPDRVIFLSSHSGPLLEGQQYELQCEVQSVAPVNNLTIIWYRGATELEQSDFPQFSINGDQSKDVTVTAHLSITASRDDHGVPYSCAARLDLNRAELIPDTKSNAVQLEVLYKPRIARKSLTMSFTEGQTQVLTCTADANPIPTYQWTHNNKTLENENKATLLIRSIQRENAGIYQCTVSNREGEDSGNMTVDVWYKPRIVSPSQKVALTEGERLAMFNCTADANPSPTYQWKHNSTTLENENKTTLLIESIQRAKAGIYECIVKNPAGETSVEMTLDVWYKPRIVSPSQKVALTEGEKPAIFNCTADANPSPTYQWKHNSKTLENENKTTLLIESIQRAKAGIYECIVKNPAGETSVEMTLDIWYKPRIVSSSHDVALTEGESLQLNCTADSNPSPTYKWTHNKNTLENRNSNTLLFEPTQWASAGVYECIASNTMGEVSATMTVDIWKKPRILSSIKDMSLTEGESLELSCKADANPRPTYQWRHNNKTLEKENKASLLIGSIQRTEAGIYECVVSNLAGETSVEMRVDISSGGNNLPWIAILVIIAIGVLLAVFIGICRSYQRKKRPGKCWVTSYTAGTTQSRRETPLNGHPE